MAISSELTIFDVIYKEVKVARQIQESLTKNSGITQLIHSAQVIRNLNDQITEINKPFKNLSHYLEISNKAFHANFKQVCDTQLLFSDALKQDRTLGQIIVQDLFKNLDYGVNLQNVKSTNFFPQPYVRVLDNNNINFRYQSELNPPNSNDASTREINAYSEKIDEVKNPNLCALLKQVDPKLVRLRIGAAQSLNQNNPDRKRHFLCSLRELWINILDSLAPNSNVIEWIGENESTEVMFQNNDPNLPTRRARLLYFGVSLKNPEMRMFHGLDMKALHNFINIFNRIHDLEPNFSEKELQILLFRSDVWMEYLIRILDQNLPIDN